MALQLWKCVSRLPLSASSVASRFISKELHSSTSSASSNSDLERVEKRVISEDERGNRGSSSDNPILVASHYDKVIVGCNCSPKDPSLNWFFLEEGPAQLCDCGYYFKLDMVTKSKWIPEYSQVMQVDRDMPDPRRSKKVEKVSDSEQLAEKTVNR